MTITAAHRVAALCAALAVAGCTDAERPVERVDAARRTPLAVPTASPAPSPVPEETPADVMDAETSEQLLLTATTALGVSVDGKHTAVDLPQSPLVDSLIEQEAGERRQVLRLNTADPRSPEGDRFAIEGVMRPGTTKTGPSLRVMFFSSSLGIDLYSDDGTCEVVFSKADASGATGRVSCPGVRGDRQADITGTFTARLAE